MSRVPVQKGKIVADQPTIGQASRDEQVRTAVSEQRLRKSGQTLTLMEPKAGKK